MFTYQTVIGYKGEILMELLAHRGYWSNGIPGNSPEALKRALECGYGIESDVRDYDGTLVISHYVAEKGCQPTEEVFRWLAEHQDKRCFAINIKADGLGELLLDQLKSDRITNYFTFDMSVPQMIEYRDLGITYFTRQSEVEPEPILYQEAAGVWVDGFFGESWIIPALLQKHIDCGKRVCVISPELHGRAYLDFWDRLKAFPIDFSKLLLCTDHPDEAGRIFEGQIAGGRKE